MPKSTNIEHDKLMKLISREEKRFRSPSKRASSSTHKTPSRHTEPPVVTAARSAAGRPAPRRVARDVDRMNLNLNEIDKRILRDYQNALQAHESGGRGAGSEPLTQLAGKNSPALMKRLTEELLPFYEREKAKGIDISSPDYVDSPELQEEFRQTIDPRPPEERAAEREAFHATERPKEERLPKFNRALESLKATPEDIKLNKDTATWAAQNQGRLPTGKADWKAFATEYGYSPDTKERYRFKHHVAPMEEYAQKRGISIEDPRLAKDFQKHEDRRERRDIAKEREHERYIDMRERFAEQEPPSYAPLSPGDISQEHHGPLWKQQSAKRTEELADIIGMQPHQRFGETEGTKGLKRFAKMSELERLGREELGEASPLNPEHKKKHDEVEDFLREGVKREEVTEGAAPFRERALRDPAERSKEHMTSYEAELTNALKRIKEQSKGEFAKNAHVFARPGLRYHGAQAKMFGKAQRKADEASSRAAAEIISKHHQHANQVALAEQHQNILGSKVHGELGATEAAHKQAKAKGLREHQRTGLHDLQTAARETISHGQADEEREQREKDDDFRNFEEERDHEKKGLAFSAGIKAGNPIYDTITTASKRRDKPRKPNAGGTLGAMLGGFGSSALSGGFKKGGRIKRAEGGPILDEALENAVVDREDPLASLNRLYHHKVAEQLLIHKKNQRQRLAAGGGVNPIEQGAQAAKRIAMQEKMEAHAARLMEPEPEVHWLKRALDAAMKAGASTGNNDWLAKTAKGYTAANESRTAEDVLRNKAKREKEQAAYGIHKDLAGQLQHEADHAENLTFKEKQLALQTRKTEAEINKMRHEMGQAQAEGIDPGDLPTLKMTPSREKALKESQEELDLIKHLKNIQTRMLEVSKRVKSNSFVGAVANNTPWGLGGDILEAGSTMIGNPVGKSEDINELNSLSNEFVIANQALDKITGGGTSVPHLKARQAGKMGISQTPGYNEKAATLTNTPHYETRAKSAIQRAIRNGMAPNQVEANRAELLGNAKEAPMPTHAVKPEHHNEAAERRAIVERLKKKLAS